MMVTLWAAVERDLSLITARRMLRVMVRSLDWLDCWAAPAVAFCDWAAMAEGAAADNAAAATPIASIWDRLFAVLIFLSTTTNIFRKLFAGRRSLGCFHIGIDAELLVAHVTAHPGNVGNFALAHHYLFPNHRLILHPNLILG